MKKTYISPVMKTADIELEALIANSPRIADGPSASPNSIGDDDVDAYQMDTKRDNLWDNLW